MNSQSFDKIAASSDILIYIFNLLDIEDQLRLAQVNFNTRHIFENFIWIANYTSLAIYTDGNCFEVTNKVGANRLLLTEGALQEFLMYYGKEVQELYTDSIVPSLKYFTHLTSLRCTLQWATMLSWLKRLVKGVPQLEILQWQGATHFEDDSPDIVIGAEVLECLMQMTNLKQLCFRTNQVSATMKYKYFPQIVYKMKLEVLKLEEIRIDPPQNKNCYRLDSKFKNEVQLKELDICPPDDLWKRYTGHFENLTTLRLSLDWQSIDNRDMQEISSKCPNLNTLTFFEIDFSSIEFLNLPSKLSELHLQFCHIINHDHLKQILTQTTIEVFTSVDTEFCGNFEPFVISPQIHTLAIDEIDMSKFQFQLHLQHLRKLSVNFDVLKDWCYLSVLLQHPPLRELHLSSFIEKEKLEPIRGFPTNVTTLNIEFVNIPGSAFAFFLDLFSQNPDMKLTFSVRRRTWKETLMFLLNHKKYPNDALEIMQVCDFKITSSDILIYIFNLLDIEDQLRLAQVNFNTRHIFENFIWIANYRSLAIYTAENCFEVTNKVGANRLLLTEEALQEFIMYYGKEVQELYTDSVVPSLKYFTHLTSLRCTLQWATMMPWLKRLANIVPQLEILSWQGATHFEDDSPDIVIGSEVLECLMPMTNLKQLYFRASHVSATMDYKDFHQFVYNMKFEVLKLEEIRIYPPENENCYRLDSKFKNDVQLKELDICPPDDFAKLHVGRFENLTILRLRLAWQSIDNRELQEMSTKCPNLKRLTLFEADFRSIKFLNLPPKLRELHLQFCHIINHEHLKQILTQTTIELFTSVDTKFHGNFEPFVISPQIHTLAIDEIDMSKFQFQLHLQHLRKLSINFGVLKDWCYLNDLLKHPPLRELHLSEFIEKVKVDTIRGFPTNVTTLNIEFVNIPGSAFAFFLDLFSQNPDMKLTFSVGRRTWKETLMFLLNHKKYPNDLEIMQVCDFKINCKLFMRNFEMAAKKFRCAAFDDFSDDDRKDTIVLYRHF